MHIKEAIRKVMSSTDLSAEEAYQTALGLMEGQASDAQIAGLLVGLHIKGETVDEIVGFVKAMREKATRVSVHKEPLVDTCGTGGDHKGTFNISTVSAFVAAAAGCTIAKHGNRSVSSQTGSADVLKELGINIDISPEKMADCIDQIGIGFLYAPRLHPAMKYAAGPRRELGVRTIFNILGPLTNPAGAKRQIIGVFDDQLTEPIAHVLKALGSEHCLVVHSENGLDEISICGKTKMAELKDGAVKTHVITCEEFGLMRRPLDTIKGADAKTNAQIARAILNGKKTAPRDIVLLNAGAAIYVADLAPDLNTGVRLAGEAIDSGKARHKLDALIDLTNQA